MAFRWSGTASLGHQPNQKVVRRFEQASEVRRGKAWPAEPHRPGFKSHRITNCVTLVLRLLTISESLFCPLSNGMVKLKPTS